MAEKRLLVVFTGGTIGSKVSGNSVGLASGQTYRLLASNDAVKEDDWRFDVVETVGILSEDARPCDWTAITRAVRESLSPAHSGVIVTHGTDTLSYIAAASAFSLVGIPVPVVLVASDKPLDDPTANGHVNFSDALSLVQDVAEGGVFVTYRNPDGKRLIHFGSRIMPAITLTHEFRSVAGSEFAIVESDCTIKRLTGTPERNQAVASWADEFSPDVLFLRPYPGLNYAAIDVDAYRAVVHETYHSGTACTASGENQTGVVEFAKKCASKGIPVLIGPVPDDVMPYESSDDFNAVGLKSFRGMRAETAYVKTSMAVGAGLIGSDLINFVCCQHVAGEFI